MRVRDAMICADRARARYSDAVRNKAFYRRQAKRAERRLGRAIIEEMLVEIDGDAVIKRIEFSRRIPRRDVLVEGDLWKWLDRLCHANEVLL